MFQFSSRFRLAALLLATPLVFAACSKDKNDPVPDEENEQITTVTYTLTPPAGGAAVTASWKDLDGTGSTAPTISALSLKPNTTYTGAISLQDETKNPPANITDKVNEEGDAHLLVYTPSSTNLLTVTRTDKDSKNLELGLATRLETKAAGTGSLRITLRHQPGTKDGSATPGDTDVEVTFPVTVQ